MKNTFSVLFYVKKQQKKSGLLPIMGRITVNKQTTQFFTQLEIDPQTTEWDSKTKKINGKGASSLNSQLRSKNQNYLSGNVSARSCAVCRAS